MKKNKYKHIIYIDESNILSKVGNSVYVCVYIDFLNNDNIAQKIIELEKKLKISHVHWVDMPWKLRIRFAEKIKDFNFICKIVVYKNPIIQDEVFKDFLIKVIKEEDLIYKIIIDGKKSKRYENDLKAILKDKGLKFHKIKFMSDKKEPLIRLTDFIAGFYRSYLDNWGNDNAYIYSLLKHKIKIPN
jgi:hypothetical protein